ncbi:MAG: tRNA pseudouridine(38-40) synthase TruA [Phycisphaeraceae bacterium]|nr:tRNA pseudouridine(38-40) synthase TruA [Phycisphaeraceae bacterium]
MPHYRLTIAYDGTDFHGWQRQEPPGAEPLRTVQGVAEHVIRTVVREPILLVGASRTDSGVHAEGQVAAFGTALDIPPDRMRMAINSRLPADVLVRSVDPCDPGFNPIADAREKCYVYRLAHGMARGRPRPLFDRHIVAAFPYILDAEAMQRAAPAFLGVHDFASFTRLHHGRESTVRTVLACDVRVIREDRMEIEVRGPGFLHNMIRIMVGTLIEIGRGARDPEAVPAMLAACDRRAAGPTAPPEGLCLQWIRYDGDDGDRAC